MKKLIVTLLLGFSAIMLTACSDRDLVIYDELQTINDDTQEYTQSTIDMDEDLLNSANESDEDEEYYGSTGALSNDEFTLEDMLLYAIQDEYAARREYDYILNTFDVTKPFSNIIKSEETHISLLIPLFDSYSITLPEDTSSEHLVTISNLEEAFDIGVYAEIMNIDMYNLFLEQDDLPDDVRDVFIKLRDASINHLSAFEKNAAKY